LNDFGVHFKNFKNFETNHSQTSFSENLLARIRLSGIIHAQVFKNCEFISVAIVIFSETVIPRRPKQKIQVSLKKV